MLTIALVANTYPEALRYAKSKFGSRIKTENKLEGRLILDNGDVVYLCYDETNRDACRSMVFDAYTIDPYYESLAEIIRLRASRP